MLLHAALNKAKSLSLSLYSMRAPVILLLSCTVATKKSTSKTMQRTPSSLCFLIAFFAVLLLTVAVGSTEVITVTFSEGGEWFLVQENVGISAMHMQLLPNNKVVMFDRTDFGSSNLTLPPGHCRYDPSDLALKLDCTAHSLLYDFVSNTIRPLTVSTDTWCSSGALVPDGHLVQTGGYNDGDHIVRTISPCPDFALCDWIELPQPLAVRRWYSSNQILPDGRIIIVGGRRQFNYEFFPNSDPPEKFDFKFLRETNQDRDEDNLYPFLHLLPDGNLFVFANTRSIIFDYRSGTIVRELPAIPGGDPRNYPSTGSSVLLPMRLSKNSPTGVERVEVLICGGAPRRAFRRALHGHFLPALSTCGRLSLTDPSPEWEMETMPIRRVMGDMLILPNGDIMIINGAKNGTAAWLLGRNPAKRPVIYHTDAPRGERFSVMNESPIARMYHSSAIVLPDGRVLVGGSNPNVKYVFSGVEFPTELRLETFSPPYLSPERIPWRPSIVFARPYRQSFSVVCFLAGEVLPAANEVDLNLLSPSFTTHSLAMNQRMLQLQVVRITRLLLPGTYEVSAVGPPTAEIAPPGYYMLFVVHRGIPSLGIWIKI